MSEEEMTSTVDALGKELTVHEPTDELMSGLREVGETMSAEWVEEVGAEGQEVLDAVE